MKALKLTLLLLALSLPSQAQEERFHYYSYGQQFTDKAQFMSRLPGVYNTADVLYRVERDPDSGLKTLIVVPTFTGIVWQDVPIPYWATREFPRSQALDLGIVQALESGFKGAFAEDVPTRIVYPYGALEIAAPQLIALDGKSNNRVATINLSTFATKFSVDLDSFRGAFALQYTPSGNLSQAWVPTFSPTAAFKMSVVNLTSGAIVTQIPTPVAAGKIFKDLTALLFSSSGNTAFAAIQHNDGTGALVLYDTASYTVKSTLPLDFQPDAAFLSPNGSTIYLVGNAPAGNKQVVYYDLLSGTADLSVILRFPVTFQAPYRMHPNGRIYGQATSNRDGDGLGGVAVYDPQARKIVSRFDFGLPFGLAIFNMQFNSDGTQLYVLDNAAIGPAGRPAAPGNVYLLDAITGYTAPSKPIGGTANLFFVAPGLQ